VASAAQPSVGSGIGSAVTPTKKRKTRKWSQHVTETSNALDLERGVFTYRDPRRIARSLKRSAERSDRRKADPFRSAMSMLTFYINRAGRQLSADQRARLEQAKDELRDLFGRPRVQPRRAGHGRR
jgi:hypothetical protein